MSTPKLTPGLYRHNDNSGLVKIVHPDGSITRLDGTTSYVSPDRLARSYTRVELGEFVTDPQRIIPSGTRVRSESPEFAQEWVILSDQCASGHLSPNCILRILAYPATPEPMVEPQEVGARVTARSDGVYGVNARVLTRTHHGRWASESGVSTWEHLLDAGWTMSPYVEEPEDES